MTDKNTHFMVVLGDCFTAKLNSWYSNDSTNIEGSKIHILTSSFDFHQTIDETSHILNNSSFYFDLILTSQPNPSTDSGVHSSLQANCHL